MALPKDTQNRLCKSKPAVINPPQNNPRTWCGKGHVCFVLFFVKAK